MPEETSPEELIKPIVLIIHGMGTHHNDEITIDANGRASSMTSTQNEVANGLKETAKHLGFEDFNLEEEVDLREFNYSKRLDEIRLKDAEKAQALAAHLPILVDNNFAADIAAKLTEEFAQADQDKFFFTHWMDVLYYGSMFWGEEIRVDLAAMLNNIFRERVQTSAPVHIIAHSLGTAVLHDTLAKVFRNDTDLTSKVPELSKELFAPDSVFMLANVSRLVHILNGIADPHSSIVNSKPDGCASRFFNYYNEFDPFTWFKRWDTDIISGENRRITTVRKFNTHDLTEYAAAPSVAYSIIATVVNKRIRSGKYEHAVVEHAKTAVNKSFEEIKAHFEDLRAEPEPSEKAKALISLFKASNEAFTRTKELFEDE